MRSPRVAATLLGALAVFALLAVACGDDSDTTSATTTSVSAGEPPPLDDGPAPWPNPDQVPARVEAAGLPGGETEELAIHYHAHLDVFVDGRSEPVADSIGRVDATFFSPLHTHATSGLIHIEAAEDQKFTLGMLFTEWGVRLTDDCVGSYCADKTPIKAYVDGKQYDGSLPDLVMESGQEIALVIGSPPANVPSSWDCYTEIDATIENPAQCADFEG